MATLTSVTAHAVSGEEQLVIFTLDDDAYGVAIGSVNTIITCPPITRVPRAPEFVEGVINLRGQILPVITLRIRFGLPEVPATKATRIVVVEVDGLQVGMIVDAVTETRRIALSAIEPLSPLVCSVDARYLRGVAKLEDRLIILLELEKILSLEEVTAVQCLGSQES